MKHLILSDIHTEFQQDNGKAFTEALPNADILILAGDVGHSNKVGHFVATLKDKYRYILYVMGNHEAYGSSILEAKRELHAIKQEGFYFLDRDIVVIEGQRYLGCSLWFSFGSMNRKLEHLMNDFTKIKNFRNEVYIENKLDYEWLASNVIKDDFVITHYLPSMKSVSSQYQSESTTRFYLTDCSWIIEDAEPAIWVHGHTHDSKDYKHDNTVVFCNPYGYHNHHLNSNFHLESLTIKEIRQGLS